LLSVLESYPSDYPEDQEIHTSWLCDTAAMKYENLAQCLADHGTIDAKNAYPKALVQRRTLKKRPDHEKGSPEKVDLSSYSINLRRGKTTNFLRDDDLVDSNKVTLQLSFFDFSLDEKSFGSMTNHESYRVAFRLFNSGLAGVIQVKLPELGKWMEFSQ
jgi:hypothetical protein